MPRVASSIDVAGLADGTRHELSLEVVSPSDGAELHLPVKMLAGPSARPVFVLIAGTLMRLATLLGAELGNDDLLATIHDLRGRRRYGVYAHFAGGVGAHRTFSSVRPGDNLFTVFRRLEGAP